MANYVPEYAGRYLAFVSKDKVAQVSCLKGYLEF